MLLLLLACGPRHTDRLLPTSTERDALTVAYLAQHCPDASPRMKPDLIVLHGTSETTMEAARSRFEAAALPADSPLRRGGDLNVGAHWLVGQDGTVWRLAPEDHVMRHTIGLNHRSIAIENVGDGPGHPLTRAQVEANRRLVREIRNRWPITRVLGHYEANGLDDLCEADDDYWGLPLDPGEDFVNAVRTP